MDTNENNIEFLTGQSSCVVSFTEQKWINKINKLYLEHKEEFEYYFKNKDGSVTAKIPKKWLKLSPVTRQGRILTEEERVAAIERLAKARQNKKKLDNG